MAVQVSGLVSGLNWQSIVTQLVAIDSAGMNAVKAQKTTVDKQVTALGSLNTDATTLENSIYDLESANTTSAVTAASLTSGSTWSVDVASGTAVGSYAVNMQHLATASVLTGGGAISQGLASSNVVTGVTLATAKVATPISAGNITVNGQQIAITTAESLQDVFTAISTATSGQVTGGYDSTTDKVTLSSSTGSLLIGAANDTSNFLQVMQLTNAHVAVSSGTASVSSTGALGALTMDSTIAQAGLAASLTGQDSSGNGSIVINGTTINYNTQTDTLRNLIGRINNSGAGVNASYDAVANRFVLTNSNTGNTGITVSDTPSAGNLAAALGLTSGTTLTAGDNAIYSVNGGTAQVSQSNTLTGDQLGVPGLTLTANTTGTQTIQVKNDTGPMMTKITAFIDAFNQFQTDTAKDTVISTDPSTGAITTSVLSANHEVSDWATGLQMTTFAAGSGLSSGTIRSLDALGIDFSGTTGQLQISDQGKLDAALNQNPAGVAAFFQTGTTGFGAVVNGAVQDIVGQIFNETQTLQSQSKSLGDHVTQMQTQLDNETAKLTAEFTAMETALSKIQADQASLGAILNANGTSSSSSSSTTSNSSANLNNSNISVGGSSGTSSTSSTSSTG